MSELKDTLVTAVIDVKIKELRDKQKLLEKLNDVAYDWFENKKGKDFSTDPKSPWPYIEEDEMILEQYITSLEEAKIILENNSSNLSVKDINKLIKKYNK